MSSLIRRWNQIGALALLLFFLALAWLIIVSPLARYWTDNREETQNELVAVAHALSLLESQNNLQVTSQQLSTVPWLQTALRGDTTSAGMQWQTAIRTAARTVGVDLLTLDPHNPTEYLTHSIVSADITISAPMRELAEFLIYAEQKLPLTRITYLQVTAPENQPDDRNPALNARLRLDALVLSTNQP